MVRFFSDNFLSAYVDVESESFLLCSASSDSRDGFSDLSAMVSAGAKLDDENMTSDDSFSLEAELTRALGGEPEVQTALADAEVEAPAIDDLQMKEALAALEVPSATDMSEAAVEDEGSEFGDLISAEFERALAEEEALAADLAAAAEMEQAAEAVEIPAMTLSAPAATTPEPSSTTEKDYSDPAAEFFGTPAHASSAQSSGPPIQTPPFQSAPSMSPPVAPVFEPPVLETAASSVQDFSDPAAEFAATMANPERTLPPAPQLDVPSVEEPTPAASPIDAVLGASAALGAAAVASSASPKPYQTPRAEEQPFTLDNEFETAIAADTAAPGITARRTQGDPMDIAFDPDPSSFGDNVTIPSPHEFQGAAATNGSAGRKAAIGVLAVALFGGMGALAWSSFSDAPSGKAPTILAETAPVKVKPKDSGGKVVPDQDRTVYEKVGGAKSDKPEQVALKDATEKPIEIAKVKPKATNRVDAGSDAANTSKDDSVLRPRAVRTMVVKPDGTILAASEPAPAAKPAKAPEQVAKAPAAKPDKSTTGGVQFTPPTAENGNTSKPAEQVAKLAPAKPVKVEPVKKAAPKPAPKAAAKPKAKPVVKKVAAKPKPAAPKPAAAPAASSPYAVQISSRRSPEAAQSAWTKLARQYRGVLASYTPDIRKKDISGRGTFYQVRVPAQTKADASALCSRLKRAGGDCFVTR
ncbi:SPOR domain-containing protein [Pseudahrensia aquimaris]|uniref:SPOR domain-containing protein n=1 Tax=Pseudahrensia aquimaris TaxID=744461 RepID=A0ABW3FM12_9HYPH